MIRLGWVCAFICECVCLLSWTDCLAGLRVCVELVFVCPFDMIAWFGLFVCLFWFDWFWLIGWSVCSEFLWFGVVWFGLVWCVCLFVCLFGELVSSDVLFCLIWFVW